MACVQQWAFHCWWLRLGLPCCRWLTIFGAFGSICEVCIPCK